MDKAIKLPQGLYLVGRDIPAGVYLITSCEKDNYMTVTLSRRDKDGDWTDDDFYLYGHETECRFGVEKGDKILLTGAFTIERIADTMIDFN